MCISEFCTISGLDKRGFTVLMSYHSVNNDDATILMCYSVDYSW